MVVITTNKSIQFTHAKRSKSSVYTESKRSKAKKKPHSESNISLVYFILLLSYRILSYHVVSYQARSILLLRKLCHFYFICLNSFHSQCTNTHIHKHIAHTHSTNVLHETYSLLFFITFSTANGIYSVEIQLLLAIFQWATYKDSFTANARNKFNLWLNLHFQIHCGMKFQYISHWHTYRKSINILVNCKLSSVINRTVHWCYWK